MKYWYWIIIAVCFLLSMFFSSADMVYSVVDVDKLEKENIKGHKTAGIAKKIAIDYEWSIASILFGNNVVNVLISSFVTMIGVVWNKDWGVFVLNLIFTILLIIFSEFLPKTISKKYSYRLSLIYAYPLFFFRYLTFIVVWPISKLFVLFGKLFKKRSIEEDVVDEDVLNEMVDDIEESGTLDEEEADIVRGAIDISDKEVYEIMTPRVDVFAIDIEDDINEIIKEGEIFKHSRIPVYEETIDNVIGILPLKALARKVFNKETVNVKELLYKPLYVPRNRELLDLLDEFKASKIHIAIVIDEYGGMDGIATMEDILEEVVGDIFDETDEIEEDYIDQGNGIYIVDGSMNLSDFFELIEYHDEFETDFATVGGLCQEILDRFAKSGDEFLFKDRYKCKVLLADEFTVEKLEVVDTLYKVEEN